MSSNLSAPPAAASGVPRAPQPSSVAAAAPSSSTPPQNAGPHLLSLKVMRASAPSLAVSEKPYYEHFDFDADADGLIKAVGQGIQDGMEHDLLSNRWGGSSASTSAADNFPISDVLVLPNSFGTLYLGETFRTYLCVRNEASTAVREPSLRVEMQVGAPDPQQSQDGGVRWHQLAHVILPTPTRYSPDPDEDDEQDRPVWELSPGQPLETTLGYDIKDLGPHVLVCTVGYKSPVQQGSEVVWVERSFRKFYKFSVDRSPISVRTKVHQPRHASSLYHPDPAIRKRVELEVQVQNVAGNGASLVFQGLTLKPAPGWKWDSVDRPSLTTSEADSDMWLRRGYNELLADGDVRQYLFTLTPDRPGTLAEEAASKGIDLGTSAEGHVIRGDALGHLDISWRMSLGEAGRLQTSQLVRRRVVTPPTSVGNGVQLRAQLTLQPGSVERLRAVKPGDVVELDVDVTVCDVSALSTEEPQDDDDTPLSEISSSPLGKRAALKRTLKLALQHCTIEAPPPSPPAPEAADPSPRKPTSRTSTPTPSALHKTRLQANLTNLVRAGSLSLQPRASVDSAESSRSATPHPPALPPKLEPAIDVPHPNPSIPAPSLAWSTIVALHKIHTETHSQALTRPTPLNITPTFTPTTNASPLGPSLTPLPDIALDGAADASATVKLSWLIAPDVRPLETVRLGAVRLVVLEGGTVVEVPVIAETVIVAG